MKFFLFVLFAFTTGCVTGTNYTHSIDITNEDFSDAKNWSMGRSCAVWVLFLGPFTSNAVHKAAANGGIKKVRSIENNVGTVIFLSWECTKVYGDPTDDEIKRRDDETKKREERKKSGFEFKAPGET